MSYFVMPSYDDSPGGTTGEWEVIKGQQRPWLMENVCVAKCLDKRMADHIASLLRRNPVEKS